MRRILIAGSRPLPHSRSAAQFEAWNSMVADCMAFIDALSPGSLVIVGGAAGIDKAAENRCHEVGIHCAVVNPPRARIKRFGKPAYLQRDAVMMALADEIYIWRFNKSRGSTYVLEHAGDKLKGLKDVEA